MGIEFYPSPSTDGKYPIKMSSKSYFGSGNFGLADTILTVTAGRKFVVKGIRISFHYLGTDIKQTQGVYVHRGSSIDYLNTLAHMIASPSTWEFEFGEGLMLNVNEPISVSYKETSGTANFTVTVWGYEI